MIDEEQLSILIYNHVVQLTLIDVEPSQAFTIAHQVAALAFDQDFTRAGLAAARERIVASTGATEATAISS